MIDTSIQLHHILDYVQLGGLSSSLDLNAAIADPTPGSPGLPGNYTAAYGVPIINNGGNTPLRGL